jgi:hypothetical protein
LAALVERVVGQFLEHQSDQFILGDTGLLLQPFDRAEERPVLALEF